MTKEEISKEFLKLSTLEKLEIILNDAKMGHLFHNYKYREEIQRERFNLEKSNKGLHGEDSVNGEIKSSEIKLRKNNKYSLTPKKTLGELGRIFSYLKSDLIYRKNTYFTLFDGIKVILEVIIEDDKEGNFRRLLEDQKLLKENKMKKKKNIRDSFCINFYVIKEYNLKYTILFKHEDLVPNKDLKWLNL